MFTGVCLSTGGVPGPGGCLVHNAPPRTATAVGGTHPTGMHSYSCVCVVVEGASDAGLLDPRARRDCRGGEHYARPRAGV